MSEVAAIIPARYQSSRFPGKVLADETGKPMVQHVYERASQAARIDRVIVATDDQRIEDAVRAFGGECVQTRSDHPNGTSRLAEAVELLAHQPSIVVNVQGDEPEIEPAAIDLAIDTLQEHPYCSVATLASVITDPELIVDPNVVKVITDQAGRALYFSRAAIPFVRDSPAAHGSVLMRYLRHIGLYAYRTPFLAAYVNLPPTPLEQAEQLEQLRVLEHGYAIAVSETISAIVGIDTPEQYRAFVDRYQASHCPAANS